MKKGLFFLLILLCVAGSGFAQEKGRVDNPIQIQFNPLGGGYNLGFHFNEYIYFGLIQSNSFTYSSSPNWGETYTRHMNEQNAWVAGQPGLREVTTHSATSRAAELRLTPWAAGLYFSIGALQRQAESVELRFDQRSRLIGQNTYNTGFTANLAFQDYAAPSVGMGLNHVFENGISFGIGMLAGLGPSRKATVTLNDFTPATTVSAADQAVLAQDFEQSEFGLAMMVHAGVGFNF